MKIELTGPPAVQETAQRAARQVSNPPKIATQSDTADRTSFRSDSNSVASLVSQALATPAVRQDRVDALRLAISAGDYKIDAEKIASAIIARNAE